LIGAVCAVILLYGFIWNQPALPQYSMWILRASLLGVTLALSALKGRGLLSVYKGNLNSEELSALDQINRRTWPRFFLLLAAIGALIFARTIHSQIETVYPAVVGTLSLVAVLAAWLQFSLKRAEQRIYARVLSETIRTG